MGLEPVIPKTTPPPTIWSDLHQSIITDAKGSIKISKNIDSVRTSIDNILRTYQGERVMLPEFASKLKDIVFEPITNELAHKISDEVKRVIEYWDDRVAVQAVDFNTDPDRNYVEITIRFVIRGYSETFSTIVPIT